MRYGLQKRFFLDQAFQKSLANHTDLCINEIYTAARPTRKG